MCHSSNRNQRTYFFTSFLYKFELEPKFVRRKIVYLRIFGSFQGLSNVIDWVLQSVCRWIDLSKQGSRVAASSIKKELNATGGHIAKATIAKILSYFVHLIIANQNGDNSNEPNVVNCYYLILINFLSGNKYGIHLFIYIKDPLWKTYRNVPCACSGWASSYGRRGPPPI